MLLQTLNLPGKGCPTEDLPKVYEQLLRENGIRTQSQITHLRVRVLEHLMSLQDAIIAQNAADTGTVTRYETSRRYNEMVYVHGMVK